jgi:hypothetical protein
MVEAMTATDVERELDALHQLATVVLNEHTDDRGLCAVWCAAAGSARPPTPGP